MLDLSHTPRSRELSEGKLDFKDYNAVVKDIVFSEHAVTDAYFYHTSSQAETRLEIDANGFLKFASVPFPKFKTLFLPKLFRKAPYEAALMDRILDNGRKFFFLQGGTGCGKSSCIRFLESECNNLIPEAWTEKTKLSGFVTRVDLQYCQGYLIRNPKRDLTQFAEDFLNIIADSFLEALVNLIACETRDEMKRIIGSKLHSKSEYSEFERQATRRILRLANVSYQEAKELYCEPEDWYNLGNAVCEGIEELEGSKKFERVFDLAHFVSSWLPKKQEIIVCFDNCDRLQKDFLIELVGRLMILDQPDANRNSKLKAFLYVRMSTVQDGASAFPRAEVVSSASLAPVSAILSRITQYLWSPARRDFYANSADEAKVLDANLLELMIILTEPFSPAREMIEAICGSDIRRSFKVATSWLLDGNFTVSRFKPEGMSFVLPRAYRATLLSLWLREYLSVWFEEFFDQCCLSGLDKKEVISLANDHANRVSTQLVSLLNADKNESVRTFVYE